MAAKLTDEQRSEIAAHPGEPIPLQDGNGHIVCYLVTTIALDNLQELRRLIQEADDSSDVPADEAHARIRQTAVEVSEKYA